MNQHLIQDAIRHLEDHRASMHFKELLGDDYSKLPLQKDLERVINELKQEVSIYKGGT